MMMRSIDSPLAGILVVEHASDLAAAFAGRQLSVLGADVVMLEPPGGSRLRQEKPFLGDSGLSAVFAYLATGKRSITVDLHSAADRWRADELLSRAAILLDDTPVAGRNALGLDEASIAARHPHLVHTAVLPFGSTGPKAGWSAQEINLVHASGEGYLLPNGLTLEMFPERPPLKIFGNFISLNAGVAAAMGALAAVLAQSKVGGQFVDVSAQEVGVLLGLMAIQQLGEGSIEHRSNRSFRYGGVVKCKDGYAEILTLEDKQWAGLVELMGNPEWAKAPELGDSGSRGRHGAHINLKLREWAAMRNIADLVDSGQRLGVPVAKYMMPREVLKGAQERARKIFAPVNLPKLGPVEMFVAPYRFGAEPFVLRGGPPELETGAVDLLRVYPVAKTPDAPQKLDRPLRGIRIVDFTIHAAGPFSTHMLTQLGAECIKVESTRRMDMFRRPHPVYGRLKPSTFAHVVADKRSVRINLKHPKGAALALRLAGTADVVAESFRAGVMDRLGLGYGALSKVKSDIIMMSLCASGQTGPESNFKGYAPLFSAWGALGTLSGYSDGPPLEIRHVMDHSIGLTAAMATVAALNARRLTGKGTHIDVAGREVACSLIGEALLEAAIGIDSERWGNAHPAMAPHGVYRAHGKDAWISIAVMGDEQWKALAQLIGSASLVKDERFATVQNRLANRDILDTIVGKWTAENSASAAAELLQSNGIAAHPSLSPQEIVSDVHLRARDAIFDVKITDDDFRPALRVPAHFSKTSAYGIEHGSPPGLGEGEEDIFGGLLGLSTAERRALEQEEVIC